MEQTKPTVIGGEDGKTVLVLENDEQRKLLTEALYNFVAHEEEETLPMLVGDESDAGWIHKRANLAADVRDKLCRHWETPHSTDRHDGEYICVHCGEEFDNMWGANR